MVSSKHIPQGQRLLNEKLVAEITDAFYNKAEKENLDSRIVNTAVKDVQSLFSGKGAKRKQCFLCGQS
jgi:hypothetical protein